MARTSFNSLSIACIYVLFCSLGVAFQMPGADGRVSISTRMAAKPATELPAAHLRVDASLVMIPVHVTNPLGASVTDLTRTNFQVFEDNVEQTITHFAKDDAPVSIGLVFDASGSMHNKLHKSS